MDMQLLVQNQLALIGTAVGFVAGVLVAWRFKRPVISVKEDPRNHRIRQLDADLRAAQRRAEEAEEAIEAKIADMNTAVETLQELRITLGDRDRDVEQLNEDLKDEMLKTRELRRELQNRATENVREHVRAEEAETELEVARAGSEAVMSEVNRLQEERKNLTNTMRQLEEKLLPDD